MNIDLEVERMRDWIARRDWQGLDAEGMAQCQAINHERAGAIASVDLAQYLADLVEMLLQGQRRVGDATVAGYWEFDVDNGWDSHLFLCTSYQAEAKADDDWATSFDAVVQGPSLPAFAAMRPSRWRGDPLTVATNAYLVARTVATFGRAAAVWSTQIPLCAGYHDQSVLFRIVP